MISLSSNDTITIKDNLEKEKATITFRENGETASQQRIQTPTNDGSEKLEGVGIPIYDALTIRTLKERKDLASIAKIFTLYNITDSIIRKNPFLKDDFKEGIIAHRLTPGFQNFITGIGEADITNFADGLSRFIVERTKEELNIYFFEQFYTFINDSAYRVDMKHLFPSTSNILSVAHNEIYDYQKYLPALREAFHKDLREILTNTSDWLGSSSNIIKAFEKRDQKLYGATRFAIDVASQINKGVHPGDVLSYLTENSADYLTKIDANFPSVIQTINVVSQSLRSLEADHYWVQKDILRNLKDDEILTIYLGLLYESIPKDLTLDEKKLRDIIEPWASNLTEARKALNKWTYTLSEIDKSLESVKSAEEDKYIYTAKLVENTASLVTNLSRTLTIFEKNDPDSEAYSEIMTKISIYASHTSSIFASIINKTWHTTVFETYSILNEIWSEDKKFNQQFLRYGTFMAAVASAENSIEVKEAIEAIALPSGSARIKREAVWNIAVNAYTGVFYGYENLPLTIEDTSNVSAVVGLSVPVGIAVSRGLKPCTPTKGGKSLTLFVSLIDVGAITAFRFKDDETEKLPEIQLKNIVAPGASLIFGFGKLPLSAGIGFQVGPQLREITAESTDIYEGYYTRGFVMLAVDIPVLNLYTKAR